MPDGDRRATATDRLLDLVSRLTGRGGRRSERTERILLALALVVFVVAGLVAWRQLPELPASPDPRWAALVLTLGAAALGINAWEFAWSARVLDAAVPVREALRVSTLSSAANVLPIPGSVAIRTRALLQGGQPLRTAAAVTTAVGVAWVAAAALIACVLLASIGEDLLAVATAAGGLAGVGLAIVVLRRTAQVTGRDLARLGLIELVSVSASGIRLYAVALTFGFGVSFGQAVTVNLGGILSNVAGFLPGGLGLREVTSGAFGALVGVPASVGVLMAAGDRILFYVVLAVAALLLLHGGTPALPDTDDAEELS